MTPSYAAGVGLLLWGNSTGKSESSGSLLSGFGKIGSAIQVKGLAGKVIDLVKSFLP